MSAFRYRPKLHSRYTRIIYSQTASLFPELFSTINIGLVVNLALEL
jgi:hypothetical protein